jgi:glutathione synthase/RimK-type ligase-like ATP-grasp enzyme
MADLHPTPTPARGAAGLRLAFATYAARPEGEPDDRYLVDALARAGAIAESRPWNDPAVDWRAYDAIVLRSTWDYFLQPAPFAEWLDARDAEGTRVLNPTSLVRWNMDKRYLRELAAAGVAVVSTHFAEPGAPPDLAAVMDAHGWDEVVVKPAISGGAHETWRTTRARAGDDQPRADALAGHSAVLIQPFLHEIEEEGEWSLLFFGGAYSHAARKRPRAGDFRVQQQFGGEYSAGVAPAAARDAAAHVLEAARALAGLDVVSLPYARVDGCMVAGEFLLMELEVIEPALFFTQDPAAAERCAGAQLGALGVQPPAGRHAG